MNPPSSLDVFLTENRLSEYFPHLEKEGYEVQDLLESDEATLLELMGGKKAHLGRLKNGLEKLREFAAGAPHTGTATALLELSGELPMVLAGPAFEFAGGHESSAVLRLWALCDLVELGVRLAVITGLAEHHGNPPEKLRGILSEKIERPTLGQWLHMARAVVAHLPQDPAFPGLTSFVSRLDKEICGHGDLSASAVVLRNRLAHGGGLGKKAAGDILSVWESRMETLAEIFSPWRNLQLVCLAADGSARLLRGTEPGPWNGQASGKGPGMVRGIVGGKELDLWPLMADSRDGDEAVSGIYSRRGEVRLEYTPFEGDFAVLEAEVDQGFLDLFRRPENRPPSPFRHQDFSEELRKEASRRIGREEELERLTQAAASLPPGGILWVGGVAGMGKSCLVASAASALLEEQKDQSLVLAYRFKAGGGRCSVEDFLAFACERIKAWEGLDKTLFQNAKEPTSAQARFLELVRSVRDGHDLLVVADGLDELPPQSDNWIDAVILASTKSQGTGTHIRWILAGRPERGIDTKLLAGGAREVFPGGLPPMRPGDVRSFFLERLSRSKVRNRLLERDEEKGLTASNPFLDEVVRRSEGLPVYMNHVAGDLIAGRITPDQERQLPKGLAAYHEELLRRCAVGDLQAVMTPLVATLALAHEPLGATLLTSILRSAGRIDSDNVPLVERALAGVSSMIRRTPLHDGTDGFTLYHTSLREHIRSTDSFRETLPAMRKKLSAFCSEAMREGRKNPPRYVRRQAVKHFLEAEDWDNATAALSDIEFIEARARAQELPSMLGDYAEAASLLPEGEKERHTEAARQAELDRYAREMSDYAATLTRIREGSAEAEPPLPRPVESMRLRPEKEIAAEIKRMTETPNRLDTVKAFRVFVATNSAPLQKYAAQEGFAANLARNDAPAGPVHEEGKRRLHPLTCIKFIKRFAPSESYNPLPACTAILEGHSGQIRSIVGTNDGRRIFSGGADNMVKFWDMDSGECIKSIGMADSVFSLTLIGGDILAAASGNEISLWSATTSQLVNVLQGHGGMVVALASTPSGHLLSMSLDGTLRIWNPHSCESIGTIRHGRTLQSLQESGGQNTLFVLALWGGFGLAATPDGKKIVYALLENNLNILDAKSGENLTTLEGHTGIVTSISLSQDGKTLVSGSLDGTVRVWDLESGKCLRTLSGHSGVVVSTSVTPDGQLIVSCGGDKKSILWEVESGKSLASISHSNDLRFSTFAPDGNTHFCGTFDGAISVWNTRQCLQNPQRLQEHGDAVGDLSFSIASKTLFSAGADNNLFAFDRESGKSRRQMVGHSGPVNSLAVSSDGRCIYSASNDRTIRVWDGESGECIGVFEGHSHPVNSIKLSESGRILFSGDGDLQTGNFSLRVWDTANGECKQQFEGHTGQIYQLAPDLNGETVYFISGTSISGDGVKKVQKWDVSTNTVESFAEGHSSTIASLVISPDGRNAFSSSIDGTVLKYDLKSGKPLGSFESPPAYQILISPDARLLFCRNHFLLNILDSSSLGCVFQFAFKGLRAIAADWSNKLLACGFSDGRIEFFKIENMTLGPWITTPRREIVSQDLPGGPLSAIPPCCAQNFPIPSTISERIESWCLEHHKVGYIDPAMLMECPNCRTHLRLNPFGIDVPVETDRFLKNDRSA